MLSLLIATVTVLAIGGGTSASANQLSAANRQAVATTSMYPSWSSLTNSQDAKSSSLTSVISRVHTSGTANETKDHDRQLAERTQSKTAPNAANQTSQQTAASAKASSSATTAKNPPATASAVSLSPVQTSCQQAQTVTQYSIAAAQASLPLATASVSWYWETRIDSGNNASSNAPITATPHTQKVSGGTLNLTASDPSQPLLVTTNNANYAYSFRLHVVIAGQSDLTSSWVSVPQASSTACL